jgi:hypothetical protein
VTAHGDLTATLVDEGIPVEQAARIAGNLIEWGWRIQEPEEVGDSIDWGDLPPSKKERVLRMIPQIEARSPKWGRLPADITKAVVLAAAADKGIALEVATRKRDGETRVWARIRA